MWKFIGFWVLLAVAPEVLVFLICGWLIFGLFALGAKAIGKVK